VEYTGLTKEEVRSGKFPDVLHPEDSERLRCQLDAAISRGVPFEHERRIRRRDGQYRWLLVQYNPLRDERGELIRWYATGTDIDDRRQAEERTRQENFALREQIDQVFMFEEIVGSSPALKTVLSGIVKVAPTDSTVLITGETGTGKELIARAIHKGSQRTRQPFITVNCAAIPSSLIASEEDTLAFSVLENIRPMIETLPLEQAADAYARMMQGKARFRMVLVTKDGVA
jgi:formate hydrogenlyase transcriptional activator